MVVRELLFEIIEFEKTGDRNPAPFEIWLPWVFNFTVSCYHKCDKVFLSSSHILNVCGRIWCVWSLSRGQTGRFRGNCAVARRGDQSLVWARIWVFGVRRLCLICEIAFCTDVLHRDWPPPLDKGPVWLWLVSIAFLVGATEPYSRIWGVRVAVLILISSDWLSRLWALTAVRLGVR